MSAADVFRWALVVALIVAALMFRQWLLYKVHEKRRR